MRDEGEIEREKVLVSGSSLLFKVLDFHLTLQEMAAGAFEVWVIVPILQIFLFPWKMRAVEDFSLWDHRPANNDMETLTEKAWPSA